MSFFFSFTKLEHRRVDQIWDVGGILEGGGKMWRRQKGVGGGMWYKCKYCVHMDVNAKTIPVETVPGMGAGG
jgi:hypothetical protein